MFGESKYLASGQAVTRVPFFLPPRSNGPEVSGSITSPSAKARRWMPLPSSSLRQTVISRRFDSALVTDTPTPCRPPEKAYAPPEPLSNLPPACRRVNTISTVEHAFFRVDADRDAAAVVLDGDGAVGVERDVDVLAVTAERLVRGVVDDFLDDVQRVFGAGVHARPLLHGFESLQDTDG